MSKKFFLVLVIWLFSALVGFSQTVINSFVAPGDNATWGLTAAKTFGGPFLFSASVSETGSVIYRLDTIGNVLSSFNWPHGIVSGLAWLGLPDDKEVLWIAEALTGNIYQATTDGTELSKIETELNDVAGLAIENSNLWVIDRQNFTVNQIDSSGSVLNSFSIFAYNGNPSGLTWDGSALWLCESFNNKIVRLSKEGDFLEAFSGPGTNATEAEWDGKYLWVSDLVTDRIYQIQVEQFPVLATAKIVFRPEKWNIQWRNPDQEECDEDGDEDEDDGEDDGENDGEDDDGDDDEGNDDDDVGGGLVADGDEGRGKINCYIGEIQAGDSSVSVKHILVQTIRLNAIVEVARKKDCDEDEDDLRVASAGVASKKQSTNGKSSDFDQESNEDCFFAKILRRHRGFAGKVLKVKFNKFEAINSLPEDIQAGDTVEVTVSGKLETGLEFEGKAKIFITGCKRTFVEDPDSRRLPKNFKLFGNFPNPFNALTQIRYHLSKDGQVELTVYNLLGKKVRVLVNERQSKGEKIIFWDGKDDSGQEAASGVYFYQLVTQNESDFGKMTLLK